ncbi:MAG: CBS domain-containing protein [Theionarchaea archaeon]|nr:CBS domain-containing protein [Theionarchaea archaeon]
MRERNPRDWKTPEFCLVVVMLAVLVLLVGIVLWMPINIPAADKTTTGKDLLEYRRTILTVIITAFGAWVGAGAAYFFGRENLREAAESLLEMRQLTPREFLRRIQVQEIPPRKLTWRVKKSDSIKDILERLRKDPSYWFIPVVTDKNTLETVIHEEAVWRFIDSKTEEKIERDKIVGATVSDVLDYLKGNEDLNKVVSGAYVLVSMDQSLADAADLMDDRNVSLAIVRDEAGIPVGFITTKDVREALFRSR